MVSVHKQRGSPSTLAARLCAVLLLALAVPHQLVLNVDAHDVVFPIDWRTYADESKPEMHPEPPYLAMGQEAIFDCPNNATVEFTASESIFVFNGCRDMIFLNMTIIDTGNDAPRSGYSLVLVNSSVSGPLVIDGPLTDVTIVMVDSLLSLGTSKTGKDAVLFFPEALLRTSLIVQRLGFQMSNEAPHVVLALDATNCTFAFGELSGQIPFYDLGVTTRGEPYAAGRSFLTVFRSQENYIDFVDVNAIFSGAIDAVPATTGLSTAVVSPIVLLNSTGDAVTFRNASISIDVAADSNASLAALPEAVSTGSILWIANKATRLRFDVGVSTLNVAAPQQAAVLWIAPNTRVRKTSLAFWSSTLNVGQWGSTNVSSHSSVAAMHELRDGSSSIYCSLLETAVNATGLNEVTVFKATSAARTVDVVNSRILSLSSNLTLQLVVPGEGDPVDTFRVLAAFSLSAFVSSNFVLYIEGGSIHENCQSATTTGGGECYVALLGPQLGASHVALVGVHSVTMNAMTNLAMVVSVNSARIMEFPMPDALHVSLVPNRTLLSASLGTLLEDVMGPTIAGDPTLQANREPRIVVNATGYAAAGFSLGSTDEAHAAYYNCTVVGASVTMVTYAAPWGAQPSAGGVMLIQVRSFDLTVIESSFDLQVIGKRAATFYVGQGTGDASGSPGNSTVTLDSTSVRTYGINVELDVAGLAIDALQTQHQSLSIAVLSSRLVTLVPDGVKNHSGGIVLQKQGDTDAALYGLSVVDSVLNTSITHVLRPDAARVAGVMVGVKTGGALVVGSANQSRTPGPDSCWQGWTDPASPAARSRCRAQVLLGDASLLRGGGMLFCGNQFFVDGTYESTVALSGVDILGGSLLFQDAATLSVEDNVFDVTVGGSQQVGFVQGFAVNTANSAFGAWRSNLSTDLTLTSTAIRVVGNNVTMRMTATPAIAVGIGLYGMLANTSAVVHRNSVDLTVSDFGSFARGYWITYFDQHGAASSQGVADIENNVFDVRGHSAVAPPAAKSLWGVGLDVTFLYDSGNVRWNSIRLMIRNNTLRVKDAAIGHFWICATLSTDSIDDVDIDSNTFAMRAANIVAIASTAPPPGALSLTITNYCRSDCTLHGSRGSRLWIHRNTLEAVAPDPAISSALAIRGQVSADLDILLEDNSFATNVTAVMLAPSVFLRCSLVRNSVQYQAGTTSEILAGNVFLAVAAANWTGFGGNVTVVDNFVGQEPNAAISSYFGFVNTTSGRRLVPMGATELLPTDASAPTFVSRCNREWNADGTPGSPLLSSVYPQGSTALSCGQCNVLIDCASVNASNVSGIVPICTCQCNRQPPNGFAWTPRCDGYVSVTRSVSLSGNTPSSTLTATVSVSRPTVSLSRITGTPTYSYGSRSVTDPSSTRTFSMSPSYSRTTTRSVSMRSSSVSRTRSFLGNEIEMLNGTKIEGIALQRGLPEDRAIAIVAVAGLGFDMPTIAADPTGAVSVRVLPFTAEPIAVEMLTGNTTLIAHTQHFASVQLPAIRRAFIPEPIRVEIRLRAQALMSRIASAPLYVNVTAVPKPVPRTPTLVTSAETAGSVASVTAGVTGSPTTAVQASRVGLLGEIRECSGELDDELEWSESPSQLTMDSGDGTGIYAGALVGNFIVIFVVIFLQWFASRIVARLRGVSATAAQTTLRYPSATMFIVILLMEPIFSYIFVIFAVSSKLVPIAVAILSFFGAATGVAVFAFWLFRRFKGTFEPRGRLEAEDTTKLDVFLDGPGKWRDLPKCKGFVDRYRLLFAEYKGDKHWYLLVEVATSGSMALAKALVVSQHCNAAAIVTVLAWLTYLVLACRLKPYVSQFGHGFAVTTATGQFVGSVLNLLYTSGMESEAIAEAVDVLIVFIMYLITARSFADFLLAIKRITRSYLKWQRRKRLAKMAAAGASDAAAEPMLPVVDPAIAAAEAEAEAARKREEEERLAAEAMQRELDEIEATIRRQREEEEAAAEAERERQAELERLMKFVPTETARRGGGFLIDAGDGDGGSGLVGGLLSAGSGGGAVAAAAIPDEDAEARAAALRDKMSAFGRVTAQGRSYDENGSGAAAAGTDDHDASEDGDAAAAAADDSEDVLGSMLGQMLVNKPPPAADSPGAMSDDLGPRVTAVATNPQHEDLEDLLAPSNPPPRDPLAGLIDDPPSQQHQQQVDDDIHDLL